MNNGEAADSTATTVPGHCAAGEVAAGHRSVFTSSGIAEFEQKNSSTRARVAADARNHKHHSLKSSMDLPIR